MRGRFRCEGLKSFSMNDPLVELFASPCFRGRDSVLRLCTATLYYDSGLRLRAHDLHHDPDLLNNPDRFQ